MNGEREAAVGARLTVQEQTMAGRDNGGESWRESGWLYSVNAGDGK
jgi:hypothetical protein